MARECAQQITRVACVGSGTIGSGWAAVFLAHGLDVIATDPGDDAERKLRADVDRAWPSLQALGLAPGASRQRLRFTSSLENAVGDAQFVQESAPDDEALKIELIANIDAATPPATIIASSSSTFLPSRLASRCRHPQRVAIGHPFVPSYLVPLVEVVVANDAPTTTPNWLEAFYRRLGKTTITLAKEIEGYVANRLQRALFDEASRLVADGVCSWIDVETAVTAGPGFRWPVQGPVLHRHLGGGRGGVRHMIEHFGWRGDPSTRDAFIETVDRRWGRVEIEELERWRDQNLLALLTHLTPAPGGDGG